MAFTKAEQQFLSWLVSRELRQFKKKEGKGAVRELPKLLAGEERYEHFLEMLLAKLTGKKLKGGHE
jgi:hypothetical protein